MEKVVVQFPQIRINKYTFLLVSCHGVQAWRLHSVIALFRVAFKISAFLYYIHVQEMGKWNEALQPATLWPLAHARLEHCAFTVDIQSSLLFTLCRNLV